MSEQATKTKTGPEQPERLVFTTAWEKPAGAIRVSATVTRCLEAGPDGLELIVFGPSHPGDGEEIAGWWA